MVWYEKHYNILSRLRAATTDGQTDRRTDGL